MTSPDEVAKEGWPGEGYHGITRGSASLDSLISTFFYPDIKVCLFVFILLMPSLHSGDIFCEPVHSPKSRATFNDE